MVTIFAKLGALKKELGAANAVMYLTDQFLKRISQNWGLYHYLFFAQPRTELKIPARRGKNIKVREAKPSDPVMQTMPRPPEVIQQRLEDGCRCLVAENEEGMVGCLWLAMDLYHEDEVRCDFVPLPAGGAVWDFDVYVAPEHRLSPVFLKLWDGAYDLMADDGRDWSISRISAYNRASLASHKRMKAHEVGHAAYLVIFGLQITYSSTSPRFHISLSRGARPVMSLGPAQPLPE